MPAYHWSIHQLTEWFVALSQEQEEDLVINLAVERATEALDAEIGAVVVGDAVRGTIGFGRVTPAPGTLLAGDGSRVRVPGIGLLHRVVVELGSELPGVLVIARLDEPFLAEERQMLLGMARILGLRIQGLRTSLAEQDRERLLETLLAIQRTISHRAPLQEVLDSITRGASRLLGGSPVALVLGEPPDPGHSVVCSTFGEDGLDDRDGLLSAARLAMASGRPGTGECEGYAAAAVHVSGEACGALVTPAPSEGRPHGLLAAFAEQASVALTDASTVKAVNEARHDALTGLPNRALFLDRLHSVLDKRGQDGGGLIVLFIDLDGFKAVNDGFGHSVGDRVLAAVAERVSACLRPADMAARLGGDEFAVLLARPCTIGDGVAVAERLIGEVQRPIDINGHEVWISASVGAAQAQGSGVSATTVLSDADIAMYNAKQQGRGRVVVFDPRMREEVVVRRQLEADLKRGVREDELCLHYQPIIRLSDGCPVAVEALARWTHPTRGAVAPKEFIDIAEQTGMIRELGHWVLQEACSQVSQWRRSLSPNLVVNVNISGKQLDSQFVDHVEKTLAETRLPASALVLEVTESVFVESCSEMMSALAGITSLGVRVAIDDFGTGYSSLSSLRRLPIRQMKIDKSLVAPIVDNDKDLAIVSTVVALATILGTETVAEGVESGAQAERLRAVGCEYAQGYHFCHPASAQVIELQLSAFEMAATRGERVGQALMAHGADLARTGGVRPRCAGGAP